MKIILILIVLVTATSGCATITRGTSEAFAIESVPAGAAVSLSTGLTCTTPCSVKVKRRSDFTVNIVKNGYEPVVATVTSSIDGAGGAGMAGNVLIGGIIGAGVDAGTGAMHSHKPNPLSVTMVKLGDIGGSSDTSRETDSGADPLGMSVGDEPNITAIDESPGDSDSDVDPLNMN